LERFCHNGAQHHDEPIVTVFAGIIICYEAVMNDSSNKEVPDLGTKRRGKYQPYSMGEFCLELE
jgi:hypothetical protein